MDGAKKLSSRRGAGLVTESLELALRPISGFPIHLTADIIGEADSLLSRMLSTGCTGASKARVLDSSDPLAKLAAKR
jgi:hypothetical protein